eukprot:6942285-Pyramimonas_sp.AAC.1
MPITGASRGTWGKPGMDCRVCLGAPKAATNSKTLTPAQSGWIRACSCDAIWTADKVLARGYQVDELCPLCRQAPD